MSAAAPVILSPIRIWEEQSTFSLKEIKRLLFVRWMFETRRLRS